MKLPKGGRGTLEDAQASAATGQILLAGLWAELLAMHGIPAAQMLLTLGDFEDRRRFLNASATLDRLLMAQDDATLDSVGGRTLGRPTQRPFDLDAMRAHEGHDLEEAA